jgi:hypothetical protein
MRRCRGRAEAADWPNTLWTNSNPPIKKLTLSMGIGDLQAKSALDEFGHTRHGSRRHFQAPIPIEMFWVEPLLGRQELIPGNLLAGVGGDASH